MYVPLKVVRMDEFWVDMKRAYAGNCEVGVLIDQRGKDVVKQMKRLNKQEMAN